ncbi:sugar transferase [Weissella confusa]|uniref:Sugar transferase n=1 Tax=Weissella confusa TaxID=1583 RepID=A0AAJ3DAB4_WEICO|nr:sugar transferase [Weissella confusa]NBA11176.1 sugar transferase [Weissella confusa]
MNSKKIYYVFKRFLDVIGSMVALLIFLPLSLYIAFRIKLEDGGPIIYKQERVGEFGEKFLMLKFRSMIVGAHSLKADVADQSDVDGPIFKIKNDPRVTNVGKFIRAHSLDEIPQFVNVLRGEMSLIGPRPALPEEVAEYTGFELERLTVRPGLSGLWQVSGRSNLKYDQMIALDLKYVQEQSMLLDIKILFLTIIQMVDSKNSGAY